MGCRGVVKVTRSHLNLPAALCSPNFSCMVSLGMHRRVELFAAQGREVFQQAGSHGGCPRSGLCLWLPTRVERGRRFLCLRSCSCSGFLLPLLPWLLLACRVELGGWGAGPGGEGWGFALEGSRGLFFR